MIRQDLTHTTGAIPAWMKQLSMACFCISPSSLLLRRCLNKCEYILPPLTEDILSFLSFIVAATNSSSDDPVTLSAAESTSRSIMPVICNGTSANSLLGRWRLCVEMFGQAFLEDVGSEPCSVLNELGRFDVKETKFRREMERLRNSTQRDLTLEVIFPSPGGFISFSEHQNKPVFHY